MGHSEPCPRAVHFPAQQARFTLSCRAPSFLPGAVGFLLYFLVAQASLLSRVVGGGNVHKAVDGAGNSVVWNTYRAVHLTIGLVIMVPVLVVAFFPFMTHFQVCPIG